MGAISGQGQPFHLKKRMIFYTEGALPPSLITVGNVLFNDTLNTFYLRLYGVKNHSDCKRGHPLPPHGLLLPISSKGSNSSKGPTCFFLYKKTLS